MAARTVCTRGAVMVFLIELTMEIIRYLMSQNGKDNINPGIISMCTLGLHLRGIVIESFVLLHDLEIEHNEMMLVPMSMPNMHHPSFSMKSDIRRAILWQSNMAVQFMNEYIGGSWEDH
jgi:hypothetical protein